jgi:hypothetical protein
VKNSILTCLLVLATPAACFGQLQNMVDDEGSAPREMLRSAKKVSVFFEIGTPMESQGAYYIPDFARAKKQVSEKLAKLRLEVVANPAEADVVIVVHEINEGADKVTICLGDKVEVFKGGKPPSATDTPIFSVNEYCGISWPLNRAMDKLIKVIKK